MKERKSIGSLVSLFPACSPFTIHLSLFTAFIAFALCLLVPLSTQAADKLIVKDAGGTNTVFSVDDTGKEYVKKLGIATLTPLSALHIAEENGADPNRGIISSQHYNGTNAAVFNYKRSRGTLAGQTALTDGDAIGAFHFWGHDGSNYHIVSSIRSIVKGAVGANSIPSQLWFHTGVTDADTLAAPRVVIDSTGNMGVATSTPTQKLDINSDGIRIRTSKTPSSSTATCNQGDMSWDSDYVYICVAANSWKRATLSSW